MPATETDSNRGKPATEVRFRFDVIDAWAAKQGAFGDSAIADLFDSDRTTIFRYRTGRISPTLARAKGFADMMGVKVDDIIVSVAAD